MNLNHCSIFPSRASFGRKTRRAWPASLVCAATTWAFSLSVAFSAVDPAADWPAWRGPTRDGIAATGQNPPVQWSETENILWKAAVPGRGHGSPTVVGDGIYLATSDPGKQNQSVLGLDRRTGKLRWQTEVHGGLPDAGKHSNSSAASSTVTCDGGQLYINFLNRGAVHTTALDLDGKILWQRKICEFVTHQGFGSSPVLHNSLVIVSADHRGGGVIAALDRDTGKSVWSASRPKLPNYTTPAIVQAGGRTQMVLAGCNLISSFDPATGKKLWELSGSTEECVVTAVTDGTRIFASGGYPRNHTVAVLADGSGKIAWQNNARVYVPSMIQKGGHLYAVMDAGMAVCWKSDTGAELWKERLGGDFFASPVMVGDRIYASNVSGKTFVFEATPQHFKLLAQNQLGDEAYASPAICASRIYLRVAKRGENRQEFLYCIGSAPDQASR
ncbi:MAG: PQQ-binding-like beta-propeller repeat protein [Verrucomicrobiales bacterium]|nr:PQQ-binding-like beta-propeller repeat protein [Verrucomicrobiales bacterium]